MASETIPDIAKNPEAYKSYRDWKKSDFNKWKCHQLVAHFINLNIYFSFKVDYLNIIKL